MRHANQLAMHDADPRVADVCGEDALDSDAINLKAYDRWAEDYPPVAHNPLMRAEQVAMLDLLPEVAGRRVLDLACGTGRYANVLQQRGVRELTAVDYSSVMLQQVASARRVQANMMQLPFVAGAFDVVVSGLALGHATSLQCWMMEVARVLDDGGQVLYSDFHPEAVHAGFTRSFKDRSAQRWTLVHHCYELGQHQQMLSSADLSCEVVREVRAGIELREEFPGSESFYCQWYGLPLVLVLRARRS